MEFVPYWLIHEAGKSHGFYIVEGPEASTSDEAIAAWKKATPKLILRGFKAHGTQVAARLITEPILPQ